jgi:hypothetical protein
MTNRVAKTTKTTTQTAILKASPKVGFSFMTLHDIQQSAKTTQAAKLKEKPKRGKLGARKS